MLKKVSKKKKKKKVCVEEELQPIKEVYSFVNEEDVILMMDRPSTPVEKK